MAQTPHLPPSYGRWDAATMLTAEEREFLAKSDQGLISFQPYQGQGHLVSLEQDRQAALQKTQMEYMMRANGPVSLLPPDIAAPLFEKKEVTDEMRHRGASQIAEQVMNPGAPSWPGELAELVYRAMHAVAPVELVPEGERIAVKERDKLLKEYKSLCERHAVVTTERDALRDRLTFLEAFYRAARDLVKANEPANPEFPRARPDDPRRMGWDGNR